MQRALRLGIAVFFIVLPVTPALADSADDAKIVHLLNRIAYGPSPGDIAHVRDIGIDKYIDEQLHPEDLPDNPQLNARLEQLSTLQASMTSLAGDYFVPPAQKKQMSEDERKETNQHENTPVRELAEAKILRAIMSSAQLQEVMTDFWFNHFNVFAEKGLDKIFISPYEREAIRPYALGKFRDLLLATAHHPAMLFYLDNWLNTDPNSLVAFRRKLGINENYAREVMELHTLGVDGGYTQQDVTTLAHILTGWGLGEGRSLAERATFTFEPRRHDSSDQVFLGTSIRGGGSGEVEQVLDMLAAHPSTARHISYELAQYFVADNPPQSLVDKLDAEFRASDGDIASVLRVLFHSPEFWVAADTQNKFKPPFRYIVSALRANGVVPPGDTRMLQNIIGQMGEPLYRCQTPNGYANTNDQWLNSDALLKRIDFARKLSNLLTFDADAPQTIEASLGDIWSATTLATVRKASAQEQVALLLSSPEFVYY